ncbi:hypothetical protein BV25DRAFT_1837088 [Artomyces pyxidatus]|uniref:Uncharacterized protein n=1 Tax=Artomyces pyxidatus TaxID=48021 RepID=A0ACB8T870_9AGAM|nr:hypothetical protein BV25DRAFT_1837088 [Artomyces pyxidatus]
MQNSHHPQAPPAQRWYVVFRGTEQGIFTDWSTAASRVIGVAGAIHRRFGRLEDAQAALAAFNEQEAAAADSLAAEMQGLVLGPGAPAAVLPPPAPTAAPPTPAAAPATLAAAAAAPPAAAPVLGTLVHAPAAASAAGAHLNVHAAPHAPPPSNASEEDLGVHVGPFGPWHGAIGGALHAHSQPAAAGNVGATYGSSPPSLWNASSVYGGGSTSAPSVASWGSHTPATLAFAPLVPTQPVVHGLPSSGRRYYAVVRGRQIGIFDYPWAAVRELIRDYPDALYRPFRTLSEASHWYLEQTEDRNDSA